MLSVLLYRRIVRLPVRSTSWTGREWIGGGHRRGWRMETVTDGERMAAGCLLVPGMAADGGWRMADGGRGGCCLLVPGMAMGWIGSCVSLSLSSAHQIDEGHGYDSSSHRRGGAFFFFSPDPLPPALLGLLALACSPVPGRGMCGPVSWLAAAGVRAACLRSHLSFRSLAVARSLVAIRSVSIVPLVPDWGVVGRFMGYSARYLVRRWCSSKHALKWHPVASDGHFRRWCPLLFLGSPRRLVLAHLPCSPPSFGCGVMAFVRAFSCGELAKTARVRSFVFGVVFRFSCHGADGIEDGLPCRVDGACGSSCLSLSVRSSPAPWGGGLCEVCGHRLRMR